MRNPTEAQLLRIFVKESDKHGGRPLYEVIVDEARRHGMAGATVLRGTLGFGIHGHFHSAKILRISEALPMVIEIVDLPERIAEFPRHLATHPCGLVIAPQPILDIVPLQRGDKGLEITQWNMDGVEDAGLIKIDILGQKGLAVISDTIEAELA